MNKLFDEVINRKNTGSEKWDFCDRIFGGENLLPLWVADMDFRVPAEVTEALTLKAVHGIFGYTSYMDSAYDSVINWFSRRHLWNIEKEWIHYSPGVVPAINLIIQAFTNPGDGVIMQRPVYHPFMKVTENNGRMVLNNPLRRNSSGSYEIDFDDLKKQAENPRAAMLLLCSPHNPVGRVWREDELAEIIKICRENNILLVSDEIHCDLVSAPYRHIPVFTIAEGYRDNIITCTAPSKTFNLAGLHISNIIISDKLKGKKFKNSLLNSGMSEPGSFATVAMEAAYNHGEKWLNRLLEYINGNYIFLKEFFSREPGRVEVIELQGTYLAWADFRKYNLGVNELDNIFLKKAGVAPSPGHVFGPEGNGYMRFNLACPRSILEKGLKRTAAAFMDL